MSDPFIPPLDPLAGSGTSIKPGYVRPIVAGGAPPYDVALENIIHDIIMGITGLAPQYIRPFYQAEPPAQPAPNIDWMGFNVSAWPAVQWPAIIQNGPVAGDTEIQHEDIEVLCSFFGPNAAGNMALLRAGLYIAQNRDMIKAQGLSFIQVGKPLRIPELTNLQWINRVDLPTSFRRKLTRTYNIKSFDNTLLAGNPTIEIEP